MKNENSANKTVMKKVKRIRPANAILLGGMVLLIGFGTTSCCNVKKASQKIGDIEQDFINNNQPYQAFILERDQRLEDRCNAGEITFKEYLDEKNRNTNHKDIKSAIDVMADKEQREEYEKAISDKSTYTTFAALGLGVGTVSALAAAANIGKHGLTTEEYITKKIKKSKKEDQIEEEMDR